MLIRHGSPAHLPAVDPCVYFLSYQKFPPSFPPFCASLQTRTDIRKRTSRATSSPQTPLPPDQKSSVRLVSSFYIILILMYIKFIYDDSNYDALILYFVSLAIGRFVYFDFTAEDFISTISKLLKNLYLLILMGSYSGFVCWFGFLVGFLLPSNGVIVSTLLAHLFMDASIFVLDRTRLIRFVL